MCMLVLFVETEVMLYKCYPLKLKPTPAAFTQTRLQLWNVLTDFKVRRDRYDKSHQTLAQYLHEAL